MSNRKTKVSKKINASRMRVSKQRKGKGFSQVLRGCVKPLLLTVICGLLAYGGYWVSPRLSRPVEQVVLEGDFRWLNQDAVYTAISENLDGGLLAIDLNGLREQVRQVPWVEDAEISRVFPNTLIVRVKEERPIVQWNEQGYISSLGEFIESPIHTELANLPELSSRLQGIAVEKGAREAIEIYHLLNSAVLVSGESIDILQQDASGGWIMVWDSGLEIDLGRSDHLERVRHALAAWQRISPQERQKIGEIDARYDNGVAVRVRRTEENGQIARDQQPAINLATTKSDNPV